MGKKGTFTSYNIKNDRRYDLLKCKSDINWLNLDDTECESIKEHYIECLKQDKVANIEKVDFINECTFLAIIQLSETQNLWNIYVVVDTDCKNVYLTLDISPPMFWQKYSNRKSFFDNLDVTVSAYRSDYTPIKQFKKEYKAYLGSDFKSVHDFENHFILCNFTEYLIWGSKWTDHPFRNKKHITNEETLLFTNLAMIQKDRFTKTVSVRTNFSKSVITVECYNNMFFLNVKYNPVNNVNCINLKDYPLDLPLDVVLAIVKFPLITDNEFTVNKDSYTIDYLLYSIKEDSKPVSQLLSMIDKHLERLI